MQAVDSFEAVKAWLEKYDERTGPIEEIRAALTDIHHRLLKVRAVAPKQDLSDRMWFLMERAGLPIRRHGRQTR